MSRLFLAVAVFAAGVFGAGIFETSNLSLSVGMSALAQETQPPPADLSAGQNLGSTAPGSGDVADPSKANSAGAHPSGSDAAGASPDATTEPNSSTTDTKDGAADATTDTAPAAQAAAVTVPPAGSDPEAVGAPTAVLPKTGGSGNLDYSIGIDVVDFHGIEPSLALTYNSSRKTKIGGLYQGWLGYGWGIDGLDVIERATSGYGMPAFTASDIYLLDGQALVACAPSCVAGGTHATENESYRRIAFNSNVWTVTDRDGTVSTFLSIAAITGTSPPVGTPGYDLANNFRWLLTSVKDTNGQVVTYTYACPASPVCYPSTITYNTDTVITFYREHIRIS